MQLFSVKQLEAQATSPTALQLSKREEQPTPHDGQLTPQITNKGTGCVVPLKKNLATKASFGL